MANVGIAPTVESNDYHFISPQVGVKYVLNAQSHIKANAGRYARIPAFFELFGDRGYFLGNENLRPETGTNIDVGVRYDFYAPPYLVPPDRCHRVRCFTTVRKI